MARPDKSPGKINDICYEERSSVVNTKLLAVALLILVVVTSQQADSFAQTRRSSARSTPAPPSLMASLPECDGVAQVTVRQLFGDVIPKGLAKNPDQLAEVNASIERFKEKTGLYPRMFEEVALGTQFSYPSEGITKLKTVALAKGTFSANAMVAAGRIASNGKYREEKYLGKTIYIFDLNESIKLFGLFNIRIGELAVAPLDSNTLAMGDPTNIRSVVDVNQAKTRANAELIEMANRDPNAVIGFGSNMSAEIIKNIDIGNAPIANDLSNLRKVYGSVGTTAKDVELFIGAKAVNAEAAKSLGDTLEGLKQLGALFVGRLSGAKGVLAKSALSNLKIVTQSNELQIRTSVAQVDVGPVVGN